MEAIRFSMFFLRHPLPLSYSDASRANRLNSQLKSHPVSAGWHWTVLINEPFDRVLLPTNHKYRFPGLQ